MKPLFYKSIEINNFRCFNHVVVEFSVPDGVNEGSGLNILIGDNGNGKTTILESINLTTLNSFTAESKLNVNDFVDKEQSIIVKASTEEFRCKMPYPGNYYESVGIEFNAKCRDRKSPGKLLSSPFVLSSKFINKHRNYKNSKDEDSQKNILDIHRQQDNDNIIDGEINIFLFDKSRSRQIESGSYSTTFNRICDDLNWKFSKGIDETNLDRLVQNVSGEYFANVLNTTQKGIGDKIAKELSEFFSNSDYDNLKVDLIDLLHPFSNAFFAIRANDTLKQIKTKHMGSGVEMILTLLLLRAISSESKGTIIYLIDEPELHLHPKAQIKLIELLLKESKDKQIILSTHSPYIFKNCCHGKANLIILRRDDKNSINLDHTGYNNWGRFPWSPSWGEINFHGYGLSTVEFHNELYGFIQEQTSN